MRRPLLCVVTFLTGCLLLAATSCGRSSSPTTPESQALDPDTPLALGGYVASDVAEAPFARYQLKVNPDGAELLPARLAAAPIGTHFNVDVTDAFSETFCTDCLRIVDFERTSEGVRVELEIEHPFALADGAAPVSATNRRDLWLSTVKGILLLDSQRSWFNGGTTLNWYRVANADGYTNLLEAPTGIDANVFPYKVFGLTTANAGNGNFDGSVGWSLNFDDPEGYLVLGNAQTARATYDLRLLTEDTVTWDFVLTGTYAVSAALKDQRLTPKYFMPSGAAPEAWKVRATAQSVLKPGDPSSSTDLVIEALDFQQLSTLSVDPDFPADLNRWGLKVSSDISEVHVSIPEMTGIEDEVIDISGATGEGTIASPWQVTAAITNTEALNEGRYYGVVKVVDERDPADPTAPVTFIGKDLVTPYTGPTEFATYAVFFVDVSSTTDCFTFEQFRTGEAEVYTEDEPLYDIADSRMELDTLVAQLTALPIAYPPIDFATQKVIVACSGRTDSGLGLRSIDIESVCPNATEGYTVTLTRGEPTGGCPTLPIPTAPYVLALVDTTNPEPSFAENIVDTCGGGCIPVAFEPVDEGDSWLLGGSYFGEATAWIATDQTEYDTIADPLYGANPKPAIDFRESAALITTAGFSSPQDGDRYSAVVEVCANLATGGIDVTWEHGEYLTCTANGEFPSVPFQIVTIPKPSGAASFKEEIVDVCQPGGDCDNPIAFTMLTQADVRNAATGGKSFARYGSGPDFDANWTRYFPEVAPPTINFTENDAWILALDQRVGSGVERLQVNNVCSDPIAGTVTVNYTYFAPTDPGCTSANTDPSRLVTVFTTPKDQGPVQPTPMFSETLVDFCSQPGCGGPPSSLIGEGNGAANWASGFGTSMSIFDRVTFGQVWRSVFGNGATPPMVDFSVETVLFATTGFHNEGEELYDVVIDNGCESGAFSSMSVVDKVPQTCPPPLPIPTTPFMFITIPRDGFSDAPGYAFTSRIADACDPGENCVPEIGVDIASGDYPENTKPGQSVAAASNATELTAIWEAFFPNAATRPPEPVVDFGMHDVVLHSSGFTAAGLGQRTRNTFGLCVDTAGEYLRIDSFLLEPTSCDPDPGASHPWACVEVPKGAAGFDIELQDEIFDSCDPGQECFDFEELSASNNSLYSAPESKYEVLTDPDLDVLKGKYRTAWAELGTGDPPGIDSLQRGDAVVILIYGFRPSHLGLHQIRMDAYCINSLGLGLIDLTRGSPLSGCNGLPTTTSPYVIYRAPDIGPIMIFNEFEEDTCP